MATATEVISTLQGRGVTLEADGTGGLRVTGISRLSDREKGMLRSHKSAILRVLERTPTSTSGQPVPTPVRASTAVARPLPNRTEPPKPAARECRNCARFKPYPFEPILGSCYALQRMQNASSKPARFGCSHFEPKEVRS